MIEFKFQFHIGSIKKKHPPPPPPLPPTFQFHIGSIKKQNKVAVSIFFKVSIPHWFN